MNALDSAVSTFLALRRIAIAGVSRDGRSPANAIYRKLRDTGHDVFAVNPNADSIDGAPCYPAVSAIPGGVSGVVIVTHPSVAPAIARDCAGIGISWVWIHRSFGTGSSSEEAVRICRENGIHVISGACPMMYAGGVDIAHRCMRWIMRVTGGLPRGEAV